MARDMGIKHRDKNIEHKQDSFKTLWEFGRDYNLQRVYDIRRVNIGKYREALRN